MSETIGQFNLKSESETLIASAHEAAAGRAATTLVKEGALRLTLLALIEGAVLTDHKAPGPVSIEVVSGSVDITVGDHSEHLEAQETLVLGANVVHAVTALTDAAILLTIAMPQA